MQTEIRSSFARDAKKLPADIKEDILEAIVHIQTAKTLSNIPDIKDIKGGKKAKDAYRMRVGDFRICFYFRNNVVELVRVLPRKDVYKVFP
ncbi:MAG TPA: type II toxin-antitoxin system RelE/ParE family toxin [Mucilaginibacter sp.]|jgi:mRNA interferase RelE/StbE